MGNECTNWIDSLSWQIEFCLRHGSASRKDAEFEWAEYERSTAGPVAVVGRIAKPLLRRLGRGGKGLSLDWLREHAAALWETRRLLADELSRLMFDQSLVLRICGHRRFYFPRIDFDDLLEIANPQPFVETGFPHDYIGMPLKVFDVNVRGRTEQPSLRVITREIQLRLVNSYRQYLIRREGFEIGPRPGSVVLDCGACIGEISMLFAALAAPAGEVHLFDPMPLHARFCRLQASLNPHYAPMLRINEVAIGDSTHESRGGQPAVEEDRISPGAISSDDFACTTIDDYARTLRRLDFIKMDIEGAEMAALAGASAAIREFRPMLAISGYHKPEDLWEIPARILQLNPGYRLAFGHHTPINWESVFYAIDPAGDGIRERLTEGRG
jgi:FkbM family methyltransferase